MKLYHKIFKKPSFSSLEKKVCFGRLYCYYVTRGFCGQISLGNALLGYSRLFWIFVWFQFLRRAYLVCAVSLIYCIRFVFCFVGFVYNRYLVGFLFWEIYLGKHYPGVVLLAGANCKGFLLSGAPLLSGDQKWEDRLGLPWTMKLKGGGAWV